MTRPSRARVGRALVDTSALLAVASARDQFHARAVTIAKRHVAAGGSWTGTSLVLAELHGHLLKRGDPALARRGVAGLLTDPAYDWVDVSTELVRSAVGAWLDRFTDQQFTLTDAVSFEVMQRERLTHAFAFDQHFETAGFQLLT